MNWKFWQWRALALGRRRWALAQKEREWTAELKQSHKDLVEERQRASEGDRKYSELFATHTAAVRAYEQALHLARPAALKTEQVRALALAALRTVPEDDPTWKAILLLIEQQSALDLNDALVLNVSAEDRAYHCGAAASARHIKGVLLDCWAQSKL